MLKEKIYMYTKKYKTKTLAIIIEMGNTENIPSQEEFTMKAQLKL